MFNASQIIRLGVMFAEQLLVPTQSILHWWVVTCGQQLWNVSNEKVIYNLTYTRMLQV
jgi:hypothetical protein